MSTPFHRDASDTEVR